MFGSGQAEGSSSPNNFNNSIGFESSGRMSHRLGSYSKFSEEQTSTPYTNFNQNYNSSYISRKYLQPPHSGEVRSSLIQQAEQPLIANNLNQHRSQSQLSEKLPFNSHQRSVNQTYLTHSHSLGGFGTTNQIGGQSKSHLLSQTDQDPAAGAGEYLQNICTEQNNARISSCSSFISQYPPQNLLTNPRNKIWMTEEGFPQSIVVDIRQLLQRPTFINYVGFDCIHDYSTNPAVIEIAVSMDGNEFINWATLEAAQKQGAQIFNVEPIGLKYNFVKFSVLETHGGRQAYVNKLIMLEDNPAANLNLSFTCQQSNSATPIIQDNLQNNVQTGALNTFSHAEMQAAQQSEADQIHRGVSASQSSQSSQRSQIDNYYGAPQTGKFNKIQPQLGGSASSSSFVQPSSTLSRLNNAHQKLFSQLNEGKEVYRRKSLKDEGNSNSLAGGDVIDRTKNAVRQSLQQPLQSLQSSSEAHLKDEIIRLQRELLNSQLQISNLGLIVEKMQDSNQSLVEQVLFTAESLRLFREEVISRLELLEENSGLVQQKTIAEQNERINTKDDKYEEMNQVEVKSIHSGQILTTNGQDYIENTQKENKEANHKRKEDSISISEVESVSSMLKKRLGDFEANISKTLRNCLSDQGMRSSVDSKAEVLTDISKTKKKHYREVNVANSYAVAKGHGFEKQLSSPNSQNSMRVLKLLDQLQNKLSQRQMKVEELTIQERKIKEKTQKKQMRRTLGYEKEVGSPTRSQQ